MAVQAIYREAGGTVVGIAGRLVGCAVTADAVQRQVGVTTGGVAGLAVHPGMNAHQRESGGVVTALHSGRVKPTIGGVAV